MIGRGTFDASSKLPTRAQAETAVDAVGRAELIELLFPNGAPPWLNAEQARALAVDRLVNGELRLTPFRLHDEVPLGRQRAKSPPGQTPAPPPQSNQKTAASTYFEIEVVDELGIAIPGIALSLTVQGFVVATSATDGAGLVRFDIQRDADGSLPTYALARIDDLNPVREAVRPRWDEARPGDWLEPSPERLLVPLRKGIEVSGQAMAERRLTIVIQPWVVRARLIGMFFDTNKSFLLPDGLSGAHSLVDLYKKHPDVTMLAVGHTDTTGTPDINDPLSLERAESVRAYLTDDIDHWLAWYGPDKPSEKRWGAKEDHDMIRSLPDAVSKPPLESPVHWYQRTRGLTPDNVAGPKTRAKLITEYMAKDGTTLPAGTSMTCHGCGENFPMAEEVPEGVKAFHRRVELYLFDAEMGIQPAPPGDISAPGTPAYPEWVKRAKQTLNQQLAGQQAAPTLSLSSKLSLVKKPHLGDQRVGLQTGTDRAFHGVGILTVNKPIVVVYDAPENGNQLELPLALTSQELGRALYVEATGASDAMDDVIFSLELLGQDAPPATDSMTCLDARIELELCPDHQSFKGPVEDAKKLEPGVPLHVSAKRDLAALHSCICRDAEKDEFDEHVLRVTVAKVKPHAFSGLVCLRASGSGRAWSTPEGEPVTGSILETPNADIPASGQVFSVEATSATNDLLRLEVEGVNGDADRALVRGLSTRFVASPDQRFGFDTMALDPDDPTPDGVWPRLCVASGQDTVVTLEIDGELREGDAVLHSSNGGAASVGALANVTTHDVKVTGQPGHLKATSVVSLRLGDDGPRCAAVEVRVYREVVVKVGIARVIDPNSPGTFMTHPMMEETELQKLFTEILRNAVVRAEVTMFAQQELPYDLDKTGSANHEISDKGGSPESKAILSCAEDLRIDNGLDFIVLFIRDFWWRYPFAKPASAGDIIIELGPSDHTKESADRYLNPASGPDSQSVPACGCSHPPGHHPPIAREVVKPSAATTVGQGSSKEAVLVTSCADGVATLASPLVNDQPIDSFLELDVGGGAGDTFAVAEDNPDSFQYQGSTWAPLPAIIALHEACHLLGPIDTVGIANLMNRDTGAAGRRPHLRFLSMPRKYRYDANNPESVSAWEDFNRDFASA